MRIRDSKLLTRGLPRIKGTEVKSVSAELSSISNKHGHAANAVLEIWDQWIRSTFNLDISLTPSAPAVQIPFSTNEGIPAGFIAFESSETENTLAFEIQLVTKFYRGLETTRLRFLEVNGIASIEVSTFFESQDLVRAIHEIPRYADSLLLELGKTPLFNLLCDGVVLSPGVEQVNAQNAKKSHLPLAQKQGLLPVIGFPGDYEAQATASNLASDVFGLAHVLVLSDELYGSLKTKKNLEGKFFVYWRDGAKGPEWFDVRTERYAFLRRILVKSLRSEYFSASWRRSQLLAQKSKSSEPTVQADASSLNEALASIRFELDFTREERDDERRKVAQLQQQIEDFVKEFDETKAQYDAKLKQVQRHNAAVFARRSKVGVETDDLIIQADLVAGSIEANLAYLTSITQGAIVFTSRVGDSWRDAKKAGYNKPKVMETVLENLCRFAVDYHATKGNLGLRAEEYAKKYDLEWIPFDSLPSPYFEFEGVTYDQSRHVKADIANTFWGQGRIHFDLDVESHRLIVNHIGSKQYENGKS